MEERIRLLLENNRELLRYLKPIDLYNLNRIVRSSLKIGDKENAILIYLKCDLRRCDNPFNPELEYEPTKYLIDSLFLNNMVNFKEFFSELLAILNKIGDKYDYQNSYKYNYLVFTIGSIANYFSYLEDKEFYSILHTIINTCNEELDHYQIDDLILDLLQQENAKLHPNQIKTIISTLYSRKYMHFDTLNGESSHPYLIDILINDERVLDLDLNNYKELIKLSTNNVYWYLFYILLKKHDISSEQLSTIIDYYKNVLPKFFKHFSCVTTKTLDSYCTNDIFSIVYNPKLLDFKIDEYKKYLNKVEKSNNPCSYAKVLNNLESDKLKIALSYIEDGYTYNKSEISPIDCKNLVARVAISPLAKCLNNEEYSKILKIVNKCINKDIELVKKDKDHYNLKRIYLEKAKIICELFEKGEFYKYNIPRLLYVINEITLSDDDYFINKIKKIAINENSSFYNDEEFVLVFDMLKKLKLLYKNDKAFYDKYYYADSYYTNAYLPFINNKVKMIRQILIISNSELEELIYDYDKKGIEQRNIESILNVSKNIQKKY